MKITGQIDTIKFERTQIIFSSSLLQLLNDHDDNDDEEEDKDDDDDNELTRTIMMLIVYKNLSRLRKSIIFFLLYIKTLVKT